MLSKTAVAFVVLAAVVLSAGPAAQADVIAYWQFNGNLNDSSVTDADLTSNGNPAPTYPSGTAIGLTMGDDAAYLPSADPDNSLFHFANSNFTIETMVNIGLNTAAQSDKGMNIVSRTGADVAWFLRASCDSGQTQPKYFLFQINNAASGNYTSFATSGTDIGDGNWHRLTVVRNTATDMVSLYIDYVLKNSMQDATTGTPANQAADLIVGASALNNTTSRQFSGQIDFIRICNDALPLLPADNSGSSSAFGTGFTMPRATTNSLAGIGTRVGSYAGTAGNDMNLNLDHYGYASFLAGTSTTNPTMAWRSRLVGEADINGTPLVSDVLKITGLTTTAYVLSMEYDEQDPAIAGNEAALAAAGKIYLVWLNGSGQWVNAIDGNTPGSNDGLYTNYQGSYAELLAAVNPDPALTDIMGAWGVDTDTHTVWAVLNHASEFAVVPEPATLGFLALGGLSMLGAAVRRRRRAA